MFYHTTLGGPHRDHTGCRSCYGQWQFAFASHVLELDDRVRRGLLALMAENP